MKHVYIFNPSTRGAEYGIGTYIRQLIEVLQGVNLKVTIVKYLSDNEYMIIQSKDGVRYISIPKANYINPNYSIDEVADRYGKSLAISLIPYITDTEENIFHLNYAKDLMLAKYLKRYIKGYIIKTIHFTEWSFLLLGNKRKFRRLLCQDLLEVDQISRNLVKAFYKEKEMLSSYCDKIVAISRHSYTNLIDLYGIAPQKICLINNALKDRYRSLSNSAKQRLKQKLNIPNDTINIVFAGRMDEIKGIFILVKAFELIVPRYKNVRLYMAGDGYWPPIMSATYTVCSNISFTGFLTQQELHRLYAVADIGVVPSIHEEFGYVAIEMMMHKLPIIVSSSTGLAEIVEHEKTGLTTTIKTGPRNFLQSARNLSENIIRLIENPNLRQALAYAGRKKFKSHYDITLFKTRLLELYEKQY